jgi:hypothetical protein
MQGHGIQRQLILTWIRGGNGPFNPLCEMHDIATKTGTAVSAFDRCLRAFIETPSRRYNILVPFQGGAQRATKKQYTLCYYILQLGFQRYQNKAYPRKLQACTRLSAPNIPLLLLFLHQAGGFLRQHFWTNSAITKSILGLARRLGA